MKTKKQSFETTMKKVPSKSPLILKIRPNEYFNFLPRDIFRRKQFRFSLPMTDELNQLITSGGQPPTEPPKYYDYNPLMKYRLQFVSNDLMTFLKKGRVKVQMIFTTTTQHTIIPTTSSTTPLNTGIATDDFEIDNNLVDKSFDRAYKY